MKNFTSRTQQIGQVGEKLAVMFLMKHGYVVLETNYTKKCGEIDIVATKDNVLHFIEVKSISRSNLDDVTQETSLYRPEENMHPKKIQRFTRTVEYYLVEKKVSETTEYQIDLALVYIDQIKRAGKVVLMEMVV